MPVIPENATAAQAEKIEDIARRFNTWPDDVRVIEAFDLPADWLYVTIGEKKGRLFAFGVSPEGEAHS